MKNTKRVLIAGIYHETHTFVPGRTTLADFAVLRGQEFWNTVGEPSPLGGVMETARTYGWEVIPAIDYRAIPSGTVEDAVLETWWSEFREVAEIALQQGPVHGIYLVLHGAMVTETCYDVEAQLLERIRSLPGLASIPLGGLTDLHANVSPQMAQLSNALVTYHKNPHTDAKERAIHAAKILDILLETNRISRTLWKQPPLVLAPTATGTADEPMLTLEAMARKMEAEHPDILAANVHAGFSFADTPNTGVSFTINTIGDDATAENLLETLCDVAMQTPPNGPMNELPIEAAIAKLNAYEKGPILLVEPSDNIGGGAPGEGVALLKAFVAHKIQSAGVIVNDPEAVLKLASLSPGERIFLKFGGKSSPLYDGGCEIEVTFVSRSDGRFTLEDPHSHMASMSGSQIEMGPCAVVRHEGVTILLTSRATAPFDLGQWRSQGIHPEQLFAIGVKAAVAHRQAYNPIAKASIYVDTPGPCSSDLRTFPYQHLRRPVRPLDEIENMHNTSDFLSTVVALPSGEKATLRPLRSDETATFGAYLLGLSAETRDRYGPHQFDQETADFICANLDPKDMLRMVAVVSQAGTPAPLERQIELPAPSEGQQEEETRIVGYFILKMGVWEGDKKRYEALGITLNEDTDCTLAPSVADDYQNQGLGSLMMQHIIEVAPQLGQKRIVLWGGVQERNERAVHFYTKWGFRKVGEFFNDRNNYDMILDLKENETKIPGRSGEERSHENQ